VLVRSHPGWALAEIKKLSIRERRFWVKSAVWDAERRL
jgi:hypothetical protein